MKNNYIIVHGSFSSPFSNWIPWLRKELEKDNLEDIKKYCNEIICYYSDNDPYVAYDAEKEFADKIATKQYCVHNGGHLNSESNYDEFKELLNYK